MKNSNENSSSPEADGYRASLLRERRILEAIRIKRVQTDFADFVHYTKPDFRMGWFHAAPAQLLDEFLSDVIAKRSPRLRLFAPPQRGKSEIRGDGNQFVSCKSRKAGADCGISAALLHSPSEVSFCEVRQETA